MMDLVTYGKFDDDDDWLDNINTGDGDVDHWGQWWWWSWWWAKGNFSLYKLTPVGYLIL